MFGTLKNVGGQKHSHLVSLVVQHEFVELGYRAGLQVSCSQLLVKNIARLAQPKIWKPSV